MSRSKAKGTGYENECLALAKTRGFTAERTGAVVGHPYDVVIDGPTGKIRVQCKIRGGRAFATMYKWMEQHEPDVVMCRADRKYTLVIQRADDYLNTQAMIRALLERIATLEKKT